MIFLFMIFEPELNLMAVRSLEQNNTQYRPIVGQPVYIRHTRTVKACGVVIRIRK
jgi:hypothetical protein